MNIGQILETHLGWAASRLGFRAVTSVFNGAREDEIAAELARAWLMDHAWDVVGERARRWIETLDYSAEDLEDENEVCILYVVDWLGDLGEYDEEK